MESIHTLAVPKKARRISKRDLRDNIDGWLFILPVVVSLLIFTVYPLYLVDGVKFS